MTREDIEQRYNASIRLYEDLIEQRQYGRAAQALIVVYSWQDVLVEVDSRGVEPVIAVLRRKTSDITVE